MQRGLALMRKPKRRGLFIVIEGVDNCGKTTQAKRLIAALRRKGVDVLPIREPGGTVVSEKVRRILLSRSVKMCPRTEVFLYLAARSQVTAEKIVPALAKGKIVVADRYNLSTYAYQIGGRGMPSDVVRKADLFARHKLEPDLTVVLDITPAQSRRRLAASNKATDRIESEPAAFFARVRQFYQAAARADRKTILLDGNRAPEDLTTEILNRVYALWK
jgi:dTMP kinase